MSSFLTLRKAPGQRCLNFHEKRKAKQWKSVVSQVLSATVPGLDYQRYEDHVTMSNPTKHGWSTCVYMCNTNIVWSYLILLLWLLCITVCSSGKNTGEKPPEKRKNGKCALAAKDTWSRGKLIASHDMCGTCSSEDPLFLPKPLGVETSPKPSDRTFVPTLRVILVKIKHDPEERERKEFLAQVELSFSTGFACCRDPAFHIALNFVLGITRKSESLVDFVEEKTEVMSAEVRDATSACLVAMGWFRVCVDPTAPGQPLQPAYGTETNGLEPQIQVWWQTDQLFAF